MKVVIGSDEVGLGCLAGPVVVAAVAFPTNLTIPSLTDSKKLTRSKRAHLIHLIDRAALHWAIASSSSRQIDKYGIAECKRTCMQAVTRLCLRKYPDARVVVDGVDPIPGVRCECIIRADEKIQAVSAASVLAKVFRDNMMMKVAEKYPRYAFDRHVGYGTPRHLRALEKYGPCPEHRRSYAPVKKVLAETK